MSATKKSRAIVISVGDNTPGNTPDDAFDRERQGVDIRDIADLDTTGLFKKIRSNSSIHRFYGDEPINEDFFDDTTAPIVPGNLSHARLLKAIDLRFIWEKRGFIGNDTRTEAFNRRSPTGAFPTPIQRIIEITVPKEAGGTKSLARDRLDGQPFTWNITFLPSKYWIKSPLGNPGFELPFSNLITIYGLSADQETNYLDINVALFCDAINGTTTALDVMTENFTGDGVNTDPNATGYPLFYYLRQAGFGPAPGAQQFGDRGQIVGKKAFSQAARTGVPGLRAAPSSTPGFVDLFATRPGISGNSIKLRNHDIMASDENPPGRFSRIVANDIVSQFQQMIGIFLQEGFGDARVKQILMNDQPGRRRRQRFLYDHIMEQRDLGQINLYDDGFPHHDIARPNYRVIMEKSISSIELPRYLVDHSSLSALDGVIDIFNTRKKIDRSTLETPYSSKGIRASTGQDQDTYRRSMIVQSGYNETNIRPAFFLDSPEAIGLLDSSDSTTTAFDIVGVQSEYTPLLDPFSDVRSDTHKFYSSTNLDTDLKNALISSSRSMENYKSYDHMSNTGFVYENSTTTVDSIAFGGLIK